MAMHAHVGQRLVVRARRQGELDRDGEILEVRGESGGPPYVVRWSDNGHVSFIYPGDDACVTSPRASVLRAAPPTGPEPARRFARA